MSTPAPVEETTSETCYRHPDRQSFIHCQRCGRTICPQCQTQAAVGVQCPECVREGRSDLAASRRANGGAVRRLVPPASTSVVTYALIGLCVVAYIAQLVTGGALTQAWQLQSELIVSQPWRLLTAAFLHASPLHILFNMYALFIFGPVLERFLGRIRFLALYLVSALGGSVGVVAIWQLVIVTNGASAKWLDGLFSPAPAVGASGAIFGLLGALLVLRRAIGVPPAQIAVVVVLNLALGFFVRGIAWEAHLGGLLIGAAIAAIYLGTRREHQRSRQVAGVVGIALALAVILVAFVVTSPPGAYA